MENKVVFSVDEAEEIIKGIDFKKMNGLVPVIAQDSKNNKVLMQAFMNKESLMKTLTTGLMHYYSRSRKEIWQKGISSGHVQKVKQILVDCDQDSLLFKVEPIVASCHKGYYSCFFRTIDGTIIEPKVFSPEEVYKEK